MLTFPPLCSHKMQSIDRSVYGPLKKFYNSACDSWMLQNGGKCLTIYDVAARLGCALPQAMTPVNIQSGFLVAGIWPFDRHVFSDNDVGCGWKLSSTGDISVEHLLPHTLVDILADKEATWIKNASLRR